MYCVAAARDRLGRETCAERFTAAFVAIFPDKADVIWTVASREARTRIPAPLGTVFRYRFPSSRWRDFDFLKSSSEFFNACLA